MTSYVVYECIKCHKLHVRFQIEEDIPRCIECQRIVKVIYIGTKEQINSLYLNIEFITSRTKVKQNTTEINNNDMEL